MTEKTHSNDPIDDEDEMIEGGDVEVIEHDPDQDPEDALADDLVEVDIDEFIEELERENDEDEQDDGRAHRHFRRGKGFDRRRHDFMPKIGGRV